ncbi:hypothetical protein [Pseudoduganella armeniaca]|uniref:hypothetical protein n=1 Tax=Pseudoduganella armeniaca TaxID=2072590 RepID=UPI0015E7687F|nr:hypothetical protein [Pseudoduganella armeniaca]
MLVAAALAPALAQEAPPLPGPGPAVTAPPAIVASAPPAPAPAPVSAPVPAPAPGPAKRTPAAAPLAPVAVPAPTPAERRARAARIDALEAAVLRRLASPEAERIFRKYNATHGRQIQHHLGDIYGKEAAFVTDAGGAGRPLGDSIVGPVTLKWLGRFCADYGIVASDPQFEQEVVASLEQVAAIARAHPDWQKVLFSADFEAWINEQPSPQRIRNLKIRRSGAAAQVNALIEQYLQARRPVQGKARTLAKRLELTYAYDPARPAAMTDLSELAARLKALVGRPPADEQWFMDDVREALAGLVVNDATIDLVKRHARVDVYMIKPEMLVQLRKGGLAEPLVRALHEQMGGVEFDSGQAFIDALTVVADASDDPAAIAQRQREIVRAARFSRYRIPATLAGDLAANAALEPALVNLFSGIAHVQYPNKELFDYALEHAVKRALNACAELDYAFARVLTDPQFEALAALRADRSQVFDRLRALRGMKGGCDPSQQVEADSLASTLYIELAASLDLKMVLETDNVVPREPPRTSSWAVSNCHCGRPAKEGVIYGFLPLWTPAGERQIDFGALTRIGLYGLTAEPDGTLRAPPGMRADSVTDRIGGLMREAHRHRVGIDWVVARSDWSSWSQATPAQRQNFFDRLADAIEYKLRLAPADGGQGVIRMASLGTDRGATGGDGIVLYLRALPPEATEMYNSFVVQLSDRLGKMRPARKLALLVDYDDVGQRDPFKHGNLVKLLQRTNTIAADVPFANSKDKRANDMPIMVLLPEPTRQTKENLRGGIRKELRGTESLRLMRTLLPIVEFDGFSRQQLADDIVYASQNFRGIGFWPLAFAAGAEVDGETSVVNSLLTWYYQPNREPPTAWDHAMSFLCPHRLWLRWLAWGALAFALVVGVLYLRCRGCNERLDNNLLYLSAMVGVMALPLLALFALVLSDPVLEPYAHVLLALYGTGGLVLAALVARYYFNKSRRKVP